MLLRSYCIAAMLVTLAPCSGTSQETVDAAVRLDLSGLSTGLVVGVYQQGSMEFLEAWGTARLGEEEHLTPDHLFPFPGFTEILIATTVRALAAAGAIDDHAPISTLLPDLPAELGAVTLDQLLTHSAGIDNAPPREGETWSEATDRLSGRAIVTDPGVIYSTSRYSYILAARVLEQATQRTLPDVLREAFLEPLGMERSTFSLVEAERLGVPQGYELSREASGPAAEVGLAAEAEGLPVLFTTVEDVIRLGSAMLDGRIASGIPVAMQGTYHNPVPSSRFVDGLMVGESRGVPRVFRQSRAQGFGVGLLFYPESETVFVAVANGGFPSRTFRFIEERIVESLQLPDSPELAPRVDPGELEGPAEPAAWAGTYRNGERIVVLKYEMGRLLYFNGVDDFPVAPVRAGVMGARIPDGRVGLTFRLIKVDDRRFVFLGNRAYALEPQ